MEEPQVVDTEIESDVVEQSEIAQDAQTEHDTVVENSANATFSNDESKDANSEEAQVNADEDDDLEEGELKDDDDDDDDDDDEGENKNDGSSSRSKANLSDDDSPRRPASSSSSSSSSNDSKGPTSSKNSSKMGSHHSSTSKGKNHSMHERGARSRISLSSRLDDKFRPSWSRDREDPNEKAAKLISMRTKLLEARSREIEMKFQKNKNITPATTATPLTLINPCPQKNLKMTIAEPSISYSENPNPPSITDEALEIFAAAKKKLKSGRSEDDEKEKKSKKKKKKKSSKKHKKHKSGSKDKLKQSKPSESKIDSESQQELELPYNNVDHQGPRTPPDNHVLTLEDEQIEWPSHLIKMTSTQPSISYSVNPDAVMDPSSEKKYDSKRRKNIIVSPIERKRHKTNEPTTSASPSMSSKNISPSNLKNEGDVTLPQKYSPSSAKPIVYETDLNHDFTWYYNYFVNSFEMDHNQAQHQAYNAIITAGTYTAKSLETWLSSRDLSLESTEKKEDSNNQSTIIKSQKDIVLPNGQVLPAGTIQKVVHPYPKLDSELLGPLYDMY